VTAQTNYSLGPPANAARSFPGIVVASGGTAVVNHPPPINVTTTGVYAQAGTISWTSVVFDDRATAPTGSYNPATNRNTVNCAGTATVSVSRLPYFKVLGGGVTSINGSVRGWNRYADSPSATDPSGQSGSGAQGAVTAANVVQGLKSAQGRLPNNLKSLTFANEGTGQPASLWGGGFGTPLGWTWGSPLPPVSGTGFGGGPINLASGNYTSGDTSTSGGAITAGRQVSLYVNGNITINDNITYPSTYDSLAEVPRIRIIATGNIFIDPAVGRVDAELYAGNYVYTCHRADFGVPISVNLDTIADSACRNNGLIVNGIVSAGAGIKLTRVRGTLRDSTSSDASRDVGTLTYTNFASGTNNIAEIFQFTPESYLALPGVVPGLLSSNQQVQSITSLPPLY